MSNIQFKENSVCYAHGKHWFSYKGNDKSLIRSCGSVIKSMHQLIDVPDFRLNEPKQGDYLPKSELDTEHKYNDAVEAFGLFGFVFNDFALSFFECLNHGEALGCCHDGLWQLGCGERHKERKLTYKQLMAIGKLKRLMNEREDEGSNADKVAKFIEEVKVTGNKIDKAYEILKSLDYEYDLVKQCWYRKEWV